MKISVITTLYFSENHIQEFYERTLKSLINIGQQYEFIFVNDGSPDRSLEKVLHLQKKDKNILIVDLSRNFGHHKAIMTGLHYCSGDFVFLIDVDLEEDPGLIEIFWQEIQKTPVIDVVFGVQNFRKGKRFERVSGRIFYRFFSLLADMKYPHDTLTARLMKKKYVESVINHREKALEIWGIFVLTGYNQKGILVNKGSKGTSTYTLKRKVKMAIETITSFSSRPLYLIFLLGIFMVSVSFAYILLVMYQRVFLNIDTYGWASLIVSIWLVGGLVMFVLGIIGIYLSKMFIELKNRPLTIVKSVIKNDK